MPGSVVTSVELRLERLPAEARPLLTAAAVLGRLFDWSLAARTVGLSEQEAAELLRLGVRAHLLDVEDAGFRFRHALTRDAVLVAATPAERARLGAAALEVLLADGDPVGEPLLLAAELAEATDPARAAELLTAAARQAVASGALASADRFATRAVELGGVEPGGVPRAARGPGARGRHRPRPHHRRGAAGPRPPGRHPRPTSSSTWARRRWWRATSTRPRPGWRRPPRWWPTTQLATPVSRRWRPTSPSSATTSTRPSPAPRSPSRPAEATDEWRVQCEAIEAIGRAERGRDVVAADVAFQRAHDIAAAHGLGVWRVRALQELGTIDMYQTLAVDRLLDARRVATEIGALAMVAILDLQLAAVYDERGELDLSLQAALRRRAGRPPVEAQHPADEPRHAGHGPRPPRRPGRDGAHDRRRSGHRGRRRLRRGWDRRQRRGHLPHRPRRPARRAGQPRPRHGDPPPPSGAGDAAARPLGPGPHPAGRRRRGGPGRGASPCRSTRR